MTQVYLRFWRATRLPLVALVLAAAVVLAHEFYPQSSPPHSVVELVDRLRQSGVRVCVVPVSRSRGDLDSGAFLSQRDRPWEELSRLPRAAEYQADWVGVVHAERWPSNEESIAFLRQQCHSCSARVGGVLLFGDAQLLRQIVAAMDR
jgi:hypothetical protein